MSVMCGRMLSNVIMASLVVGSSLTSFRSVLTPQTLQTLPGEQGEHLMSIRTDMATGPPPEICLQLWSSHCHLIWLAFLPIR